MYTHMLTTLVRQATHSTNYAIHVLTIEWAATEHAFLATPGMTHLEPSAAQ